MGIDRKTNNESGHNSSNNNLDDRLWNWGLKILLVASFTLAIYAAMSSCDIISGYKPQHKNSQQQLYEPIKAKPLNPLYQTK